MPKPGSPILSASARRCRSRESARTAVGVRPAVYKGSALSTYLTHGGAERERTLASLWATLESRVRRQEQVGIDDLRPALATRCQGWREDEHSLVHALSGHAYHRVMVVVAQIAEDLDSPMGSGTCERELLGTATEKLYELRIAYGLLQVSRQLAEELNELDSLNDRQGLTRWPRRA